MADTVKSIADVGTAIKKFTETSSSDSIISGNISDKELDDEIHKTKYTATSSRVSINSNLVLHSRAVVLR